MFKSSSADNQKLPLGSSSKKNKNESMEFVQRGGGQTPNPNFFGIHFGSIDIKIWGRSRAINTYFWIQTLGGRGGQQKVWTKSILLFFISFDELPKQHVIISCYALYCHSPNQAHN